MWIETVLLTIIYWTNQQQRAINGLIINDKDT